MRCLQNYGGGGGKSTVLNCTIYIWGGHYTFMGVFSEILVHKTRNNTHNSWVMLDDTAITSWRCIVTRRRYLLEVLASEFKGHEQAHAWWLTVVFNNKMAECDAAFNLVKKPHTTSSVWAHFGLKCKMYNPKSQRVWELNDAVAHFLAQDMQPFYTVEKPGFKRMLRMLDPKYSLPLRKYFSDTEISRLYSKLKEGVVKPAVQRCWLFHSNYWLVDQLCQTPVLEFHCAFITNDWELRSFCLDTVPVFEDYASLSKTYLETGNFRVSSWFVQPTDNGFNFIAAFETLEWTWISCFGHNLDLAVKKALNIQRVQRAIGRCHSLVGVFSRSWKK